MDSPEFLTSSEFDRFRAKDQRVFKKVYNEYFGLISYVVGRCGVSESICLDIVQETFLKLFARVHEINNPQGIKSWLVVTAKNLAIDHFRKAKRNESNNDCETAHDYRLNGEFNLIEVHRHEMEVTLIGDLISEITKQTNDDTFELFYRNGLTAQQIATNKNLPVSTVTNRISRTRKRFKEKIKQRIEQLRNSIY